MLAMVMQAIIIKAPTMNPLTPGFEHEVFVGGVGAPVAGVGCGGGGGLGRGLTGEEDGVDIEEKRRVR